MPLRRRDEDSSTYEAIQFYAGVFFCFLQERHAAVIQKTTGLAIGGENEGAAGVEDSGGTREALVQLAGRERQGIVEEQIAILQECIHAAI